MERRKKDEEDNAYELKRKDKILQIDAEIKIKESGISVAEESVNEGNMKLQQQLTKQTISHSELQKAQSLIDMGLSRKRVLELEIEGLKEKIKRLVLIFYAEHNILLVTLKIFNFAGTKFRDHPNF